jgi:hypothetical protein
MKSNQTNFGKTVHTFTVSALLAGMLLTPGSSNAGLADKIVDLKSKVQDKVEIVKDKAADIKGDAVEQIVEMVLPMIQFIKKQQEGYKDFTGVNNCGQGSPCAVFRQKISKMIVSFATLPEQLPFVETIPTAVKQLEELAQLVDYLPPTMLYAAEKTLAQSFDEIQFRLDMLRFAASNIPAIPTMAELSQSVASSQQVNYAADSSGGKRAKKSSAANPAYPANCALILDKAKPHIDLVLTAIKTVHEQIKDTADVLPNEVTVGVTAVAGGTYSVKHPAKGGLDLVILVIKSIERDLTLRLAIHKSFCAALGYQAP